MSAPNCIERLTEAACLVGITAQLSAHSVTAPAFRTEFGDESGSGSEEIIDLANGTLIIKPGIAAQEGKNTKQHTVPVTLLIITHAPSDLLNAKRHPLFESIINTLKSRDFQVDFDSEGNGGTWNATLVEGGLFRYEDNQSIAEIETLWKVCT